MLAAPDVVVFAMQITLVIAAVLVVVALVTAVSGEAATRKDGPNSGGKFENQRYSTRLTSAWKKGK